MLCRQFFLASGSRQFVRGSVRSLSGSGSSDNVKIEYGDNGVSHLILNRHDGKNSFSKAMLEEFNRAVSSLQESKTTNVVVVSSGVPKVFCAGADLKERATMPESEVPEFVARLRSAFSALEALPMPTIAAIEGVALGGGLVSKIFSLNNGSSF